MHYKPSILYALVVLILTTGTPCMGWGKDMHTARAKSGFIANVGQVTDLSKHSRTDIDYKLGTDNFSVFISKQGLQYQWYNETVQVEEAAKHSGRPSIPSSMVETYAMQVVLLGANRDAVAVSAEQQSYYENYYLPHCYGKRAHSYNRVVYKDIYPNIDWVLYTDGEKVDGFKYDFIVRPGGRISDIRLQYKGADKLQIEDGAVIAKRFMGSIREERPHTYDAVTGKELVSSFELTDNVVSFNVEDNETKNTIIIDPKLNWATYYGLYGYNEGYTVASDTFGNSYLCGHTADVTNLASFNVDRNTIAGSYDVYIVQFDNTGTQRNWGTYYGGEGLDLVAASVCDLSGDIYITGSTKSVSGISTFGAQQLKNGCYSTAVYVDTTDAFLAKFNMYTGNIVWGTYLGGPNVEYSRAVACDRSGHVYIAGYTLSKDSIATPGAFQTTAGKGFLDKYNTANGQRVWGTFFNGYANGVAVDNRDNVVIAGLTDSYVGIATAQAYDATPAATGNSAYDGYIAMFRKDGNKVWGTYNNGFEALAVVCDSLSNVYSCGMDLTPVDYATTPVALWTTPSSIIKLDSSCVKKWGTPIDSLRASCLRLSPDQKIYFGGRVDIMVPPPPPNGPKVTLDARLGKLSKDGKILFNIFYGNNHVDLTQNENYISISYDAGKLYIGGTTSSKKGIATKNSYLDTLKTNFAGFLAQFQGDTNVYIRFPYIDTVLCAGQQLNIKYGVTNIFRPGNVFTIQLSNASGSFISPVNIGSTIYNDQGEIACTIPASTLEGVGYKLRIISSAPMDTFYNYDMPSRISHYHQPRGVAMQPVCANLSVTMVDTTSTPPAPTDVRYTWISPDVGRPVGQSNPNIFTNLSLADAGDIIVIANNHGCIKKDTFHMDVTVAPGEPLVIGDTSLCIGESLRLTGRSTTPVDSFAWFNADGTFYGYDSVITRSAVTLTHAGLYKITAMLNGCQSSPAYGQVVTVHPLPLPTATSNAPVCAGDTLKLTASDTTKNVAYSWSGPQGFIHNKKDSAIKNVTMSFSGQYMVKTTTIHGCENTASTTVTIKPLPNDVRPTSNSPVCTGKELLLNAGNQPAGAMFNWTGPNSYAGQQQYNIRNNITFNDAGLYKLRVNLDGCIKEDTTRIVVNESPEKPKLSSNSPLLTGEVLKLNIDNAQQGLRYNWTGPRGFISQATDPTLNNVIPAMSGLYTATVSNGICTAYDTIMVIITDKKEADPSSMLIFPNPNNGVFRIKGKTQLDAVIELVVYASDGKKVYKTSVKPVNKQVDETITIGGLACGVYRLRIWIDGEPQTLSFTIKP